MAKERANRQGAPKDLKVYPAAGLAAGCSLSASWRAQSHLPCVWVFCLVLGDSFCGVAVVN